MGKRHLTPDEIKAQCKDIAREKRMAERTPWTAMGIMCAYSIMKKEGFKGQRISRLANRVNEMEEQWSKGGINLKEVSEKLMDKAEWTITHTTYTEADIRAKRVHTSTGLTESRLVRKMRSMSRRPDTCYFSLRR